MIDSFASTPGLPPAILVRQGKDRFSESRGLGISQLSFKITAQDHPGLFVLENTFHQKGGPARHLHLHQDEWFYILEGEFIFEVGQERMRLSAGDSLLGPRNVPHVWAFDGDATGRILIAFLPAGKMEAFFRAVTQTDAMPIQDPELWRAHDMEWVGPPLALT